jgi:hypothetical protein
MTKKFQSWRTRTMRVSVIKIKSQEGEPIFMRKFFWRSWGWIQELLVARQAFYCLIHTSIQSRKKLYSNRFHPVGELPCPEREMEMYWTWKKVDPKYLNSIRTFGTYFFFLGSMGVWTQGLTLVRQALLTLEQLCSHFCKHLCNGFFEIWFLKLFPQGLMVNLHPPVDSAGIYSFFSSGMCFSFSNKYLLL